MLLAQDGLAWRGRRAFEGGDAQAGAPRRRADGEVAEVLDVKKHEAVELSTDQAPLPRISRHLLVLVLNPAVFCFIVLFLLVCK